MKLSPRAFTTLNYLLVCLNVEHLAPGSIPYLQGNIKHLRDVSRDWPRPRFLGFNNLLVNHPVQIFLNQISRHGAISPIFECVLKIPHVSLEPMVLEMLLNKGFSPAIAALAHGEDNTFPPSIILSPDSDHNMPTDRV